MSSDTGSYATAASSASSTSSLEASMCSAISAVVGERPSLPVSAGIARFTFIRRSWIARGTRTVQPASRKWRLISPRIVGTAKLENAVPRSSS